MIQAFFRDSVLYSIPILISRGLFIFLIPLYTRVLSPTDFGALDMLMAFGAIVNLTVAMEVSQGVARYYADEREVDRKIIYASTAFWFTLLCYSLFLSLSLHFSEVLSRLVLGVEGLESVFRIGMFFLWLNGLFYLIQNQFRWELRSRDFAMVSLLVTVTTAALAVALAYGLEWGLKGLIYSMIGGSMLGCLYGIWHLRNSFRFRFSQSMLKEMLWFSIPLVPSGVAVFFSSYIDRIMLNHYLSLEDVGLYGVGFRLASLIVLVMAGFQSALTPLVYSQYRHPDTPQKLAVIFRIFMTAGLFVFLGLSLFSVEILRMMTTPAFYRAEKVVILLAPAILLSSMYIFAPGIGIAKKTYLLLLINGAGAVFCVALNVLLIPGSGIMGAAVAKLLGYGAIFVAYMAISQRLYPVPHDWWRLTGAAAVTALLAIFGRDITSLETGHVWAKGTLFIPLIVVVFMFGLVKVQEMSQACQTVLRKMHHHRS